MIFDTSVVLKILKDRTFFKEIRSFIDEEVKITSITAYELLRGAVYIKLSRHSEKELNIVLSLMSDVDVIPFEKEDAKIASIIWAKLKERRTPVNDADVLIASMCIRKNERLLTLDEDFLKIKRIHEEFDVKVLSNKTTGD